MTPLGRCPSDECLLRWLKQPEVDVDPIADHLEICEECARRIKRLSGPNSAQRVAIQHNPPQPLPPEVPGYAYDRDEAGFPRLLGEGGFGSVFSAVRRSDGRQVAIKWLKVHAEFGTEERAAFLREATAALSLDHANIVRGLEVDTCNNRFFYVMEFVSPGKDLHAWQNGKPLLGGDPHRFVRIAELLHQLAEGLNEAHRVSLIHRDLNYRNVLVKTAQGTQEIERLKIADFGLARSQGTIEPTRMNSEQLGVLPFMAPELFSRDAAISPALDLYSLGVMGYFMLTGTTPYSGGDPGLANQIRAGKWTPLRQLCPEVPADLETILGKCLRTQPQDRYRSATELAHDLDRFRQGQRIRSWRTLKYDRVATFTRTNPGLSALFSAVSVLFVMVLLFLGLAGYEWWRAEQNGEQARRNERLAQDETRERLIASARAALKRGDLANAEQFFDRAIEISPTEQQRELEFERLPTLTPNGRWDRLRAELDRLGIVEDLTPAQRARLLLHQGDYDLMESVVATQTRGKKRLREALALGLPPVETAYARGLLATGLSAATAEFEKVTAPTADPFHYRGNCCLLACYLLSGRHDEARQRADLMERVFPNEAIVPLMRALLATVERDAASAAHYRDRLQRQLPPEQSKPMLGMLVWLEKVIRTGSRSNDLSALAQPITFAGLPLGDIPRQIGVGLPVWHHCFDQYALMASAYVWILAGWNDLADQELRKAGEMSPEGFIRFQQGMVTYNRLATLVRQKKHDTREMIRLSRLASRQFTEASEAPTLIRFMPFRRQAVWLRYAAEASIRTLQNSEQEKSLAVGWVGLSPLETIAPLAVVRQSVPSSLGSEAFAQLLKPDPEGDREVRAALLPGLLYNVCTPEERRLLLQRWILDEPANPRPRELLKNLRTGS
jgi:tetratricopeptide (TPR) repeat protein